MRFVWGCVRGGSVVSQVVSQATVGLRNTVVDSVRVDTARRDADPPSLRVRQPLTPFPELDCIRHLLPVGVVAEAERRAREVGVSADRALVSAGAITEHDYVTALARHLGVPFEMLKTTPREICPHDDERLLAASAAGMLPLKKDNGLSIVVAPRKHAARQLCMLSRSGDLPPRLSLTTGDELQHFVDHHCIAAIEHRAAKYLKASQPQLSAAHFDWRLRSLGGFIVVAMAAGAVMVPAATHLTLAIIFLLLFVAWTMLRLLALTKENIVTRVTTPHPHDLPEYTIVVALYREAPVVAGADIASGGRDLASAKNISSNPLRPLPACGAG